MRRTISFTVLGAALVAVAVSSGIASGRGARAAVTLNLTSKVEHVNYVDNGPQGRSAGDVLIFTEKLLDAQGHTVGSDAASCTYLFDQRSLCTGAYVFAKGRVMVQLVQPGPTGAYTQAITGGTGRFARATGTVRVDQHAGGDHFTLHIRLPAG